MEEAKTLSKDLSFSKKMKAFMGGSMLFFLVFHPKVLRPVMHFAYWVLIVLAFKAGAEGWLF